MWSWPDRLGRPLLFVIVAATYAVGARLAILLIEASGLQGVFYIPAGITVAFLLRLPLRYWWVVLVGAGFAEVAMDLLGGYTVPQSMGYTAANLIEPLVGAAIVRPAVNRLDLARRRHLLWFLFGAVLLGPAVGAGVGAVADRAFGGDDLWTTFGQWWLGDALGVALVGSAILVWGSSPDRRPLRSLRGAALIGGSAIFTFVLLELSDYPLMFFVLVGVLLAGVVFGTRAVVMTCLVIALTIAVRISVDTATLIGGLTPAQALLLVKLQLGTFVIAGLVIAAESHERELAIRLADSAALQAAVSETERSRERGLAIELQRGLLPDRLPSMPGIDVAARYEAAGQALEVGGDWYDALEFSDGRIGVVIGDVVGHGLDAMISMGRLRSALAALALHSASPASLLRELDEFVGGPDGTAYATVFYAIVDLENQTIVYSSAGHPPGLLISPDGETTWLDEGQTEPLYGVSTVRREATASLVPGAALILYSDGLIERRGESLNVGLERLQRLASAVIDKPPQAMCDDLFASLVPVTPRDDAVVLVMKAAMDTAEFHEVFPALPDELRNVRATLRDWISDRKISDDVAEDLLISVSEAASNAARHAYGDTLSGDVTVRVTLSDGSLNVEVGDQGQWRESPEGPHPGLGLRLIESLAEDMRIDKSRGGTRVTFRLPLA